MNKLPIYVSESDFDTFILPQLSHKIGHNRQKVSYQFIFNMILYVLKSGCSWRTLKPDNQLVTWKIFTITMLNGQKMAVLKNFLKLPEAIF